jgi:hypothetical protein
MVNVELAALSRPFLHHSTFTIQHSPFAFRDSPLRVIHQQRAALHRRERQMLNGEW